MILTAAVAVFVLGCWVAWFLVAVVSAMPTHTPECPDGCKCRGQLSNLDHMSGLRATNEGASR